MPLCSSGTAGLLGEPKVFLKSTTEMYFKTPKSLDFETIFFKMIDEVWIAPYIFRSQKIYWKTFNFHHPPTFYNSPV
jgi:hypothetical protein